MNLCQQACQSISDGLSKSASAMVQSPLSKYRRGASMGSALASAVQSAPAAAIAPASAAARAVHCALLGFRNRFCYFPCALLCAFACPATYLPFLSAFRMAALIPSIRKSLWRNTWAEVHRMNPSSRFCKQANIIYAALCHH